MLATHNCLFDWNALNKEINSSKAVRLRFDIGLSDSAPNSQEWIKTCKDTLIISIEPVSSSFSSSKDHLFPLIQSAGYRNNTLIMLNCGLDNIEDSELQKINIAKNDVGCSSFYGINDDSGVKHSHEEEVLVLSFKKILDNIDWSIFKHIDYLKIDTQGKDLEIIKNCSSYHHKIHLMEVETTTHNSYIGAPDHQEIVDYIKNQGFEFVRYANEIYHPNDKFDHVYRYKG